MRKKLLSSLLLFQAFFLFSQTKVDSLQRLITNAKEDTTKVNALNRLAEELSNTNINQSLEYASQAEVLGDKLQFTSGLISANNNIGIAYYFMGSYPEALNSFIRSTQLLEKTGNKKRMGAVCNNIAAIYLELKKYKDAEIYFMKSLKVDEELGNKKGLGESYNNIGTVYKEQNKYTEALDFYNKSLQFRYESNDSDGLPATLTNIGVVYMYLHNYDKAYEDLTQALAIYKHNKDQMGIALAYTDLGDLYGAQKKPEKSIVYYDSSLTIAKDNDVLSYESYDYQQLASSFALLNNFQKAYQFHCLYMNANDSIFNTENAKQLNEMQTKYETEKKEKEIIQSRAESQMQSTVKNVFIIGFALMVILAFVIFRGYRNKKRTNEVITVQKQEVEKQKLSVELQKEIIEEKSKEIVDSINYAKRIQDTILPPQKLVKELLPDSFILFKPKDIVSGDFYWVEPWGEKILFAAVDCTGHGVPGALMSMVGVNLLNKALNELGLSKPNLILNSLSKGIGKTLRQTGSGSEIKDGMDLALCSYDKKSMKLEYSGAYNPLWIIREGMVMETIADKNPIGTYLDGEIRNYINHEIQLKKNDSIYIFTDGFADQFGGEKGKKFKYKSLKQLLLSVQDKSMEEQLTIINKSFIDWKGHLDQVDDILIIGVMV